MSKIIIKKVVNKLAKNGKTKLCSVKTNDKNGNEVWINGFGNTTTESWKDGQTVELEIYQEEFNGKTSLKFKEPAERSIFEELDKINDKLDLILFNGKKVDPTVPPQILEEKQTTEQILDSIPF